MLRPRPGALGYALFTELPTKCILGSLTGPNPNALISLVGASMGL
jgi:hypothetical protein